jgi:benzodiazapine receptor
VNIEGTVQLVVSIVVCQFVGFIGSIFTMASIPTWYASLNKPFFKPPNWLFAPVWIILYTLMGVSLSLVLHKRPIDRGMRLALAAFITQLILNVLWSIAFFGLRSLIGGLVVIGILWIAISATVIAFLKISRIAGAMLVPYLLWTSFAAVLNFALLMLNS